MANLAARLAATAQAGQLRADPLPNVADAVALAALGLRVQEHEPAAGCVPLLGQRRLRELLQFRG